MKHLFVILFSFFLSAVAFGQNTHPHQGDKHKSSGPGGKIAIDTINSKLLLGKWYDFTPEFEDEQANYVAYYVKSQNQLKDSTGYTGTMLFKADGSFKNTVKLNGRIATSIHGQWEVVSGSRDIKLVYAIEHEYKGKMETTTRVISVLELNPEVLILKY